MKIVSGVLSPVVTVHMQDTCVMVHPGKSSQALHVVECGQATDSLLTSLQYSQAKEVGLMTPACMNHRTNYSKT